MSQRYSGGIITANPTAPTTTSASGVWTLEQQFQNSATWPKSSAVAVSRSVRLRASASAYLNRTPASAGNQQKWTWSGWVKRGTLGAYQTIFGQGTGTAANGYGFIRFDNTDTFTISASPDGATSSIVWTSTAVYRDPAAWYHIVAVLDTTQATAANRFILYVNGVAQAGSFSTTPSQNANIQINRAAAHQMGAANATGLANYLDGYLTEVNFIDGQALDPTYFGFFDSTGIWQPSSYTGQYGTNGFYLNFSDNSGVTATTIGKDYSGNGNNWTPNNISVTAGATYDSMIDVPTPYADGGNGRGNYCVLNRLDADTSAVSTSITNGNLTASGTTYGATVYTCSMQIPQTGKWYWEVVYSTITTTIALGVRSSSTGSTDIQYYSNGNKNVGGTTTAYGSTWTTGDIIACAVDRDAGTVTWYKNNVSQGAISIPNNAAVFDIAFNVLSPYGSTTFNANFGQRPFTYTPPTGFVALNTQNLPDATIKAGNKHFDVVTRTGNGTSYTNSSLQFQPDLLWSKDRSVIRDHRLVDSVRGVTKELYSDLTSAEATDAAGLTAFNANGYSIGSSAGYNQSGNSLVDWLWNAGGNTVSNTSGSITSSVRANPTAGISVVTYTGNGVNGATFGHGLGVAPKMVIGRRRDATEDWPVYHASLTAGNNLRLNSTQLQFTYSSTTSGGIASVSSVVVTTGQGSTTNGSMNASGGTYVAYCFAEVAGYSKFGSYTGNGSTDGPFVYCGFRPKCVFIKRTDSAGNWYIYDSVRDAYNAISKDIYPNLSNAESENYPTVTLDIVSNGFKLRRGGVDQNASGGTYIFAAFAENPFKTSRAR